MRIGLLVDLAGRRQWHRWLADSLAGAGHELVVFAPPGGAQSLPAPLNLALGFDRFYFRQHGTHAFDAVAAAAAFPVQQAGHGRLDVLIDVSASTNQIAAAARVIRVEFGGLPSELGAVAALLEPEPFAFALTDSAASAPEIARPAIARRDCLTEALDSVFSSLAELLVARIDRPLSAGVEADAGAHRTLMPSRRPGAATAAAQHVRKLLAAKVDRYVRRRTAKPRKWSIALRRCTGPGLVAGAWPGEATYTVIPDDGQRYYADPILFLHEGRTFLFCEEFPFETQRGIISVAEVGDDGRVGVPRPVLERPYHLSYPLVFAHGGEIWMMPETAAANCVELYRAVEFPFRWERDRTLVAGVAGCDATIVEHGGRHYMFLTQTQFLGSTWDKLHIYSADSPLGPWAECPGGLVCVDSTLARPAGPTLTRQGRLLRPAQNCSRFYGGAMTLLDVEELTEHTYRHRAVAEIVVTSRDDRTGTHTYARAGDFEAVDVWGDLAGVPTVTLACRPLATTPVT